MKIPDLKKPTVANLLNLSEDRLPPKVRRCLEIRQSLSKSSTAKYKAMVDRQYNNRVHDTLMYHGASTGRWTAKGIQPQNLPRGNFKDVDFCIDLIKAKDAEGIECLYGDLMGAISTCIRSALCASPGHELLCADFHSIEARVLAWLADEAHVIEAFESGRDLYKVAAAAIYGKKYEDITKSERQIGKVCITEGQLVTTEKGLTPIEKLNKDDRVWDGQEWVSHKGLIYQGEKEVMYYDGLSATPDHEVFVEGREGKIPFWQAAQKLEKLRSGRICKQENWERCNNIEQDKKRKRLDSFLEGSVCNLQRRKVDKQKQFIAGEDKRLSELRANNKSFFENLGEALLSNHFKVQRSAESCICPLWRKRNKEYFQESEGFYSLCREESPQLRLLQKRNRPNRQRGQLCPRKSEIVEQTRELQQQVYYSIFDLPKQEDSKVVCLSCGKIFRPRSEICCANPFEFSSKGVINRRNYSQVPRYAELQTKRVYDIADCGHRNSFTVSGKVVSNCTLSLGYQGGVNAFQSMAINYGVKIDDDIAQSIVDNWREGHPKIKQFWWDTEKAAVNAVEKGQSYKVGKITWATVGNFLHCKLPSGRVLSYYKPKLKETLTPWGKMKNVLHFTGVDTFSKKWSDQTTYGGKFAENCIAEDMEVLTNSGWKPIQYVDLNDKVWDGEAWVAHSGVVFKGNQLTSVYHGVSMTSDHLVLTEKGWKHASQSSRYNRVKSRIPNGFELLWQRGKKTLRERRLARQPAFYKAGFHESRVFDILNCGPNNRFVVRGNTKVREEPIIVHNCTQAVARDFMAEAMLRLEAAGYKILLTVHDEIIAEVREGEGSLEEFEKIMSVVPEWGSGCPIGAEGWRGKRYRK